MIHCLHLPMIFPHFAYLSHPDMRTFSLNTLTYLPAKTTNFRISCPYASQRTLTNPCTISKSFIVGGGGELNTDSGFRGGGGPAFRSGWILAMNWSVNVNETRRAISAPMWNWWFWPHRLHEEDPGKHFLLWITPFTLTFSCSHAHCTNHRAVIVVRPSVRASVRHPRRVRRVAPIQSHRQERDRTNAAKSYDVAITQRPKSSPDLLIPSLSRLQDTFFGSILLWIVIWFFLTRMATHSLVGIRYIMNMTKDGFHKAPSQPHAGFCRICKIGL